MTIDRGSIVLKITIIRFQLENTNKSYKKKLFIFRGIANGWFFCIYFTNKKLFLLLVFWIKINLEKYYYMDVRILDTAIFVICKIKYIL